MSKPVLAAGEEKRAVRTETEEAWARFRATHPELYAAELRALPSWPYLSSAESRVS